MLNKAIQVKKGQKLKANQQKFLEKNLSCSHQSRKLIIKLGFRKIIARIFYYFYINSDYNFIIIKEINLLNTDKNISCYAPSNNIDNCLLW